MKKKDLEHSFYIENKLVLELGNVGNYDTLSPYRYVTDYFFSINQKIKSGKKLKVISNGEAFLIETEEDFINWIQSKFNDEFNYGFEEYVNKKIEDDKPSKSDSIILKLFILLRRLFIKSHNCW
ncbi:MAG: hypothetical protein ACK5UE_09540 [Chitinophagales bacterium]|jgi:hypothetical protein|nr:hypothetical protein [Sphingobacteriales bacterium]